MAIAERIKGLSIGLDLDSIGLNRSLAEIKRSFRGLNSSIKTNMNNLRFGEKSVESYEKGIESLNKDIEAQRKNLDDLAKKHAEAVREQGENSRAAVNLATEYNKQADNLNRLERQLATATEELERMKKEQRIAESSWGRLGTTFQETGTRLKDLSGTMQGVGSTLTKAITVPIMGVTTAVSGMVASFGWGRLKGIDEARAQLQGMGYDAKQVESISSEVSKAIQGGMMTMAEGTSVAAGALAAGVKQGAELERYIKLVDAAAVGANSSVSEMAMIFNRVQGSGRIMTQELNMIEERMPGFSQTFADHLGVSMEEFRSMVTEGKVSSSDFLDVMENFAGGMADAYAGTWSGMVANTKANIGIIGENLLSGVFEQSKESISEFLELLRSDDLRGWAAETGQRIGEAFSSVVSWLKDAIQWFIGLDDSKKKLIATFSAFLVALGPILAMGGMFLGFIGNIMTGLSPLLTAIAQAGRLLNILRTAFMALTGPVGMTIAIISLLVAGFVSLYKNSETFREVMQPVIDKLKEIGSTIKDYLLSGLDAIRNFFDEIRDRFTAFKENEGSQLGEAFQNLSTIVSAAFTAILTVVQFVMPAIKWIIEQVWGNIKGIITGALDIILGAVKIFSGLLTGDFSKMWEGVKQLFMGAVNLVWNWFNIMFIGRILRGVGGFAKNIVSRLKTGWDNTINGIKSFVGKAKDWFKDLFDGAKKRFDDMVDAAKKLPQRMGDGLKSMASKVVDGVKSVANKMTETLGKGVNGVISGINWVLGKINVKKIPKWEVPVYAKGTDGHPGGLAIVNDGPGSHYRELIHTPDGQTFIPKGRNVLLNLPKGTSVLPGKQTSELLGGIPRYAKGIGDFFGLLFDGPKKLITKVWDKFIPNLDDATGLVGKIARGSVKLIKNKAFDFLKGKLDSFMSSFSGGIGGKGVERWRPVILRAAAMMNEAVTTAQVNGILAQIRRESGGNEKIIQSRAVWDINWQRGNPARGLLQYIPQTFNRYAVKGFTDIFNGFHQLLAFFNNTNWRKDLPYGRRGWGPTGRRKYATGGLINSEGLYHLGEEGPEWIIPTAPHRRTEAMKLLALAGKQIHGNKRPNQLPNVTSQSDESIINVLLEQNELLRQLLAKDGHVYLDKEIVGRLVAEPVKQHLERRQIRKMRGRGIPT